jgi:PAS domain S-box-containing protein
MQGETVQYENDYYSTREHQQWYSTTFTPVWENGEINGSCVAIQDITSQKLSQEKIIKSEENLRTIFDNALQAFILMDPDGTIKAFNAHAIKYVRVAYETDIKLGVSLLDILDEKMKHFLKDIIQKTLKGETFQFSRAFETDRGKLIWLDFTISPVSRDNKVTGFCIVGSDITEKKTMEREREFDRKNLESLINNTGDLMWSVDRNRHLITYNKPFADLVLLSTGTPITKDTDLLAVHYDQKTRKRFKGFYERALTGESFTEIIDNEGPESSWSEISFYPIYNEQEVIGTACFLRNITERKKYEELLLKTAREKETFIKELSQNNKDLQQFAYITSHNLRGPVASLMGLSNLLDNYTIEDPTLLQILDGIKKSTFRFDETIKDLNTILTVKDTPSVQQEKISFSVTFQKILDQCDFLIKNCNAEIVYDFSNSPEIDFNKAYLESILLNLVTNALKYRDKKRPLKIETWTEVIKGRPVLRFKDNGIGIDTKLHKEKLFQLYQRFHHHLEGKGLGLFLIKSQLEAFGGSIEIKSEVNVGTEFIIHF